MSITKIEFYPANNDTKDQFVDYIIDLLGALRMNGQICGREFPIAETVEGYTSFIMLPDKDSLSQEHDNRYVRNDTSRIRGISSKDVKIVIIGKDPSSADGCTCKSPTSYILYTTFGSLESPVSCGDCFLPVPLYRLPPTADAEYLTIITWQGDYHACGTLYLHDTTAVRTATREIAQVESSLNRHGRAISNQLTQSTGVPTYYYLRRFLGKSRRQAVADRCPICGELWLLETPWHGRFGVRCDTDRIVSDSIADF